MGTSSQDSPPRRAAPKVFISYRRRSDEAYAHMLSRDLIKEFGRDAVFLDAESIAGGDEFPEKIKAALASCNTFLALTSVGWLKEAERLQDPEDSVRVEIAAALASDVRVIPVLVNAAQMPDKKDLPADLRKFTSRNYEELRGTR